MAENRTRRGTSQPLLTRRDVNAKIRQPIDADVHGHVVSAGKGATKPSPSVEQSEDEDEDEDDLEHAVEEDIRKLEDAFVGIDKRYKVLSRIGEGTFSTVYKAEDLQYDLYANDWDFESCENLQFSPSRKRKRSKTQPKRHFVAIKKIYVTSSPHRIMNELELLHALKDCAAVCPLITAFRHQDQVVAILPYFRHVDFRHYFRDMSWADMRKYFRSLFTGLAAVHEQGILHRDIKPTNFLYDPTRKEGVVVDFGLAERQGTESAHCLCQLSERHRLKRFDQSYHNTRDPLGGYPVKDQRPSLRANRAGTRGFRAPEVLFKCTMQTTKIDIWSVGVILLTILSKRFPFFNSTDDVEAIIEMSTVFGRNRMAKAAILHGQVFETTLPTITENGYSLEKIVLWSTQRSSRQRDGKRVVLEEDESLALDLLESCLDLNPANRMSAEDALIHPFILGPPEEGSENEMDILSV